MKQKLKNTLLYKKGYNNRYCLLAALCTFLIMTIVYFCYDLAPFGNITILRMDLYHQYGPLFAELYERIAQGDSLLYSWTSGGGSPFLGNFFNYLASPTAIVMLILGHKNMPEAIALMILLKACFASFTFSYFISKKFKVQSPLTSAFGVLYACSGYFIAYYWNIMWLDSFYLFPLVMLGIEKLISERKMKLYIVTLALTMITNYYMGYMVCIFSVIYFIYYYFSCFNFADTYFGKLEGRQKGFKSFAKWGYNNLRNSRFFDSGVRFAFSSISAALLACFALVPVYFVLSNCSATSGTWPTEVKSYFTIFDFLANHLAYIDPTIRSSGTDVLPNVYCGVLTVMLVPLFIFSKKVSTNEKIMSVATLGVMFLSFNNNYLNYIWHGFHFPNDLPYRFSYMYSFLLLIMAFRAITFIKEYSTRQIIGVGTATVFFIILVQEIGSKNFNDVGVWICVVFIGIYCIALGILKNDRYPAIAAAALILCSVCAEYTVSNTNNYSMDQAKVNFVGDYDNFQKIKTKIDKHNKSDMYRMELTNLRARMDPCWYYYNGLSTFTSMAYEKVANMQSHLGMFSNYINSYTYNRQTPIYNAFFALDYVVDNATGSKVPMNSELYKEIAKEAKYTAYENQYKLPIAFRTKGNMITWSHDNSNPFEVQSGLFGTATGINNVFTDMEITSIKTSGATCSNVTSNDGGNLPYAITDDSGASITFEVTAKGNGNGYIYLKSSNNDIESITITLPSGNAVSQNIDTKPYVYDLGKLKKGEKITIYAPFEEIKDGYLQLYGVTLNINEFKKGYDILKKDSLKVESFTETNIKGKLNASDDGIVFTSINYDKGWSVYVDGKKLKSNEIYGLGNNALLGFNVFKGEHTIESKYTPQGLYIGILISLITLILLILLNSLIKTGFFKFNPLLYKKDDETLETIELDDIIDSNIETKDISGNNVNSENPENSGE